MAEMLECLFLQFYIKNEGKSFESPKCLSEILLNILYP